MTTTTTTFTLRPRRVEIEGGISLELVESGDPAGEPVVLLHGITDSWRSWQPLLPELGSGIRAIAISQRGHGDSDRPFAGYATADLAADVAGVLDGLGVETATVVGHSMGSTIARRFAVDHADRTAALVLEGSVAGFAGRSDMDEFAAVVGSLADPIDPEFYREFQASTLVGGIYPAFFETIVAESCKVPARVFQAALAGIFADDVMADLGRITVPTLLAWGENDPYCRRVDQDAILAGIPQAELSVYQGVAHNPHWEEPQRFAAELEALVARLS